MNSLESLKGKGKVGEDSEEGGIRYIYFFPYSFENFLLGERRGSLMRHGFSFLFFWPGFLL
jgi:hypothetical protein